MGTYTEARTMISDIKNIATEIKNKEINDKLIELQLLVSDIINDNLETKEKLEEIENDINLDSRLVYEKNAYYLDEDDRPYCQICWERDKKLIHLEIGNFTGDQAVCRNCETTVREIRNQNK